VSQKDFDRFHVEFLFKHHSYLVKLFVDRQDKKKSDVGCLNQKENVVTFSVNEVLLFVFVVAR
jgi:hypothetical protein